MQESHYSLWFSLFIFFLCQFFACFLDCSYYGYCSSKFCDSDSCCSFSFFKDNGDIFSLLLNYNQEIKKDNLLDEQYPCEKKNQQSKSALKNIHYFACTNIILANCILTICPKDRIKDIL